ncbi:hypothetical protein DID76_01945 [Candidatus Marinamargulisbacteria bacterium SCGC AG-414-C22]|nr:hypothetical protein DID76_01945 [Candidatus Marinamargulisbacteria bacterium SCGC AG-414-C22]
MIICTMKKKLIVTIIFCLLGYLCCLAVYHITAGIKTPQKIAISLTETEWKELAQQESVYERGKMQFKLRCYKCHGFSGEGNDKGPSLRDSEWIYGNDYSSIYETIHDGKPENGMYGYAQKLLPSDIQALTIYVQSLTNNP